MKTNIILCLFFSFTITTFAQNRVLLKPGGEIISISETPISLDLNNEKTDKSINTSSQFLQTKSVNAWLDTLTYFRDDTPNTNFGFFGQDWLLQWFVVPSDMIIHKAGISFADVPNAHVEVEVKLVKLKWNKSELQKRRAIYLGYYIAQGNGYNNITAFQDNPDRTGDWVDSSDLGLSSPFAEDVWSDSGVGMVVYPEIIAKPNYQWIDLDILEKEVIVKSNEIIGVAVRNLHSEMDSMRVGIRAGSVDGYTGFKFYSNGRLQPGVDFGWWSRAYTFDFALEIELLEGGCWPFRDHAVSYVPTTLSPLPREVTAIVNHCGLEDINKSKVELNYSFDKGITFAKTEMTTTDADSLVQTFKGWIPDAGCGITVIYYASYFNAAGTSFESDPLSYFTRPCYGKDNPSLIVFNGFSKTTGFPPSYYFGFNGSTTDSSEIIIFPRDKWAYGKLTKELVENYQNIFEITTTGPKDNNNAVIREWLAASPKHNYFLAGDEYLGSFVSWWDPKYYAGDFPYDVLGISRHYTEINYATGGDEKKASLAFAVIETELGDSLQRKLVTLNEDSLKIDPTYKLGSTYSNWLDGFETIAGTVVDITAQGIDGKTYNVAAHRTLPAGNKIAFLTFDPLSLRGAAPNYFWYGFDRVSPLVQAMRWFGADVVDVEDENSSPTNFNLAQNFPNPFNPSTVISWQLAVHSFVTLKVHDILGNEVATLVNEVRPAGNYKTDFKGNNLASGIYFYTLRAGSFVQSRKMILLK